MATLTGKTIGRYQVGERLGRGGMAEVYKAYHVRLDRHAAIKVLYAHMVEGKDFRARFEREARAVAGLKHPHIPQIYDYDIQDDLIYMAMEFIDGQSLQALMASNAQRAVHMSLERVRDICVHVAIALHYAHEQEVLHRDVKPSNILIDEAGEAFLTDFGIACIVSDTQFTATGALIGTPAYMSPEQGRGEELSPASDVYSLGIILYEMFANRVPFEADTPLAVIHKQIHELLPPLQQYRPNLPEDVVATVEQALEKDPEKRFRSARDFALALKSVISVGGPAEDDETASDFVQGQDEQAVAQEVYAATVVMEDAEARSDIETDLGTEPVEETESDQSKEGLQDGVAVSSRKNLEETAASGEISPQGVPFSLSRRGWITLVGVLLLAILIVGASIIARQSFGDDATLHTYNVRSSDIWFDTGLRVEQGQRIHIEGSGEVNLAADARQEFFISPGGHPEATCSESDCLLFDAPYGVLLARVGSGPIIKVGDELTCTADYSGNLLLSVNDRKIYFEDNDGAYHVEVRVSE